MIDPWDDTPAVAHKERAHSVLGASTAKRWMNCPGSVRLSADVPTPPASVYAMEGTQAHELAEEMLRGNWIGRHSRTDIEPEMIDHAAGYASYCNGIVTERSALRLIEARISLASLKPPVDMFGTADFVVYDPQTFSLHVVDLKYGRGLHVSAEDNPQLLYYALGVTLLPEMRGRRVDRIVCHIYQPRVQDGISHSEYDPLDLDIFADTLLTAARNTQKPDAPLKAGAWCQFCPAAGQCPAKARQALVSAQDEFGVLLDAGAPPLVLPAINSLTGEQMARIIAATKSLTDWLGAVNQAAKGRLNNGLEIPGYKLVAKHGARRWRNEAEFLVDASFENVDTDLTKTTTTIASPAQAEKKLAALWGDAARAKAFVAGHVERVSSGATIAPADDKRPALPTGGAEFDVLPVEITDEQ